MSLVPLSHCEALSYGLHGPTYFLVFMLTAPLPLSQGEGCFAVHRSSGSDDSLSVYRLPLTAAGHLDLSAPIPATSIVRRPATPSFDARAVSAVFTLSLLVPVPQKYFARFSAVTFACTTVVQVCMYTACTPPARRSLSLSLKQSAFTT